MAGENRVPARIRHCSRRPSRYFPVRAARKVLMRKGANSAWLESLLLVEPAAELACIVNRLRNNHSQLESNQVWSQPSCSR